MSIGYGFVSCSCHSEGHEYLPPEHIPRSFLFIRFYLFQRHSILCPARPRLLHVYSVIFFTPGLCFYKHGSFLALGYENMPLQASIGFAALALDSPIIYIQLFECIHDDMRTLNDWLLIQPSPDRARFDAEPEMPTQLKDCP